MDHGNLMLNILLLIIEIVQCMPICPMESTLAHALLKKTMLHRLCVTIVLVRDWCIWLFFYFGSVMHYVFATQVIIYRFVIPYQDWKPSWPYPEFFNRSFLTATRCLLFFRGAGDFQNLLGISQCCVRALGDERSGGPWPPSPTIFWRNRKENRRKNRQIGGDHCPSLPTRRRSCF